MKIAIAYFSQTGNTSKTAQVIASGVKKAGDIEVKCMSIEDMDYDFIKESKSVIFGTPTYYASMAWQLKKWFDTSNKCDLSGKLGACFATANFMGGGSETAESNMIMHMLVKGMIVFSGGGAYGQPFTHLGASLIKDGDDFQKQRAEIFGERIGKKAIELFSK